MAWNTLRRPVEGLGRQYLLVITLMVLGPGLLLLAWLLSLKRIVKLEGSGEVANLFGGAVYWMPWNRSSEDFSSLAKLSCREFW
jgi:hypothetical protein